jgi:flagellar biosynthetic protein FlhB
LYKQVRLEAAIPAALYRAVAKVLAYVYQQQQRAGLPT